MPVTIPSKPAQPQTQPAADDDEDFFSDSKPVAQNPPPQKAPAPKPQPPADEEEDFFN